MAQYGAKSLTRGVWCQSACSTVDTSRAEVRESTEANSVTSWPRRTNSSVSVLTTRSVPP